MGKHVLGWISVLVSGFAWAGSAGSAAGQKPVDTITDSTTVVAVEIPVTVVRKSEALTGLRSTDFEVLVDGEPTPIIGLEAIDFTITTVEGGDDTPEPSAAGKRHFLFFFDLSLTPKQQAQRNLDSARDMLSTDFHPSDRIGVGIYAETLGGRMVSGFTEDRLATQLALEALDVLVRGSKREDVDRVRMMVAEAGDRASEGLRQLAAEAPAYLRLQGGGVVAAQSLAGEAAATTSLGGAGGGGRAGGIPDLLTETLMEMEETYQEEIRPEQVRAQSFRFLGTMRDLAEALRDVRGQRFFVLFSAGVEEWILEDSVSGGAGRQLTEILDDFGRSGWEVHAVSSATPASSLTGGTLAPGLTFLASATGGRFYRNMQPTAALGLMMEQMSASYVLTVQPAVLGAVGSYHEIEVRLPKGVKGQVRHRAGFYTPSITAFEPRSFDALAVGSEVAAWEDGGALAPRVFAVAWKPEQTVESEGAARVPIVVEIAGSLLGTESAATAPRQLWVDAYRLVPPSGAVPLFVQPLVIDPVQHAKALDPAGGVKVFAEAELPAGEHSIRVVVRDPADESRSVTTALVSVPDFSEAQPQVMPPIYPDLDNRWIYVSHSGAQPVTSEVFPFRFKAKQFMPQASARVAAGTQLPVFLAGADLPDGGQALRLYLETESGEPIPNDRLQIAGASERDSNGLLRVMARLDTAGLDPGGYRLRLAWSDDERGIVREAWRPFTVIE